ncbi:MAG: ATP-binding protein [Pontibacterium sp.]
MSLRLKTILGIALIEAALLALLISMTLNYLQSTNYDGLHKRITTTATLFSTTTKDAVISYDLASLEAFCTELMKNSDILYVKVLSPRGDVFAEAGDAAYLTKPFKEDIRVANVNDGVFDVSANIEEGGELFGRVELGLDTESLNHEITEARTWSATIAFGEMILVALFSYMLGTYLTQRLTELREAANKISDGNTQINLKVVGDDEVAEVAKAFNEMSSRITYEAEQRNAYEQQLIELNHSLESRIERRTEQLERNIAELELTNQRLEEAQQQLIQAEKMASIGTLAAGVAHEINNPIGYVVSNVRTLSDYNQVYQKAIHRVREIFAKAPDEQHEALKTFQVWLEAQDIDFIQEDIPELMTDTLEGTTRILDIVTGLREFSHSSPTQVLCAENLNQAVENVLKITRSELKYKAVVETNLGEIPEVVCNIGQIQQVLLNLIINASHAIEEKGVITIKSGVQDDHVYVSIQDNGSGIPPGIQEKIFDPFFTTKKVGKGTGLGLSIAYGIMKDHKGRVELESEEGKGSRFTLFFPLERRAFPDLYDVQTPLSSRA